MIRMPGVGGGRGIRSTPGRWLIGAASFVRQLRFVLQAFPAVSDCFEPLRRVAADMRGFESIRTFHQRAPAIPLIAMSGYAFANLNSPAPDFLRMALELGATHCLRKPFTPDALLAAIKNCFAENRSAGDVASAARLG